MTLYVDSHVIFGMILNHSVVTVAMVTDHKGDLLKPTL